VAFVDTTDSSDHFHVYIHFGGALLTLQREMEFVPIDFSGQFLYPFKKKKAQD